MSVFSAIINGVEHIEHDMESLLGHAFSDLEALGIGVGGGVAWLVKFLIDMGEDPVTTIAHLSGRISSLGGNVTGTLEELASGIMHDGVMGFATKKVRQALAPMEESLHQSTARGQAVASVHQTTIQTMQSKLNALRTAGMTSWEGQSVESMQTSLTSLSGGIGSLTSPLEGDGAQATLNRVCLAALEAIVIAGAIIVVLEIIVTAIVAVAAIETGPVDLAIVGGGGALIAETLEVIEILILADLLAWLLGTLAIYAVEGVQAIIHHMAKGGKQNVGDTGIENEARALIESGKAATMCEALAILMDQAKTAKDSKRQQRIKATQKAHGCRHKGGD
jgi:hypothetical protein